MRRWLVFSSTAGLVLAALALGVVESLYRWQVRPKVESNRAVQARHLALYQDDLSYLGQFDILKSRKTGKADAGPWLNRKLFWSPVREVSSETSPLPAVAIPVREELLRLRSEWMDKHHKARTAKADLSFFMGLGQFDYWDIETHSPIEELAARNIFVPPPELPVPEVSDLLAAAKLRLMRGALDKEAMTALQDVRNLARLLLTTENMNLVLAGIAILDDERKAYRYFVDHQGLSESAWIPIDRNTTRRAYRAILATRGYLRIWTRPDTMDEIYLKGAEPVGLCAAANEAFPQTFALAPVLKPHWPLEFDLRDEYAKLDQVLDRSRSSCRLKYLSALIETENFATELPGPFLLNRLPYSRKIFGLRTSVNRFSGFDAYNALAALGGSGLSTQ